MLDEGCGIVDESTIPQVQTVAPATRTNRRGAPHEGPAPQSLVAAGADILPMWHGSFTMAKGLKAGGFSPIQMYLQSLKTAHTGVEVDTYYRLPHPF